jgi:multiple sugar transport system ATP-binding protein
MGTVHRLDFIAPGGNNSGMARVVLEHLTKVFSGQKGENVRAVEDVNLTVEDKELVVLVGPSGCGKTTTLRLIAGLEDATSGSVSIDGQAMNGVAPKERDVAMVFQNHALYPHMTGYENMAFGLKLRRLPRPEIQKRVKEAAELLDLSDCLDRLPQALSGGERQRVALGRAIVRRPKVFLFDEPLSNLDAPMRGQMRAEIARLHSRLGATMIYVTHDQIEAMTLGQRIAVMNEGVIQQVGGPMEVYEHPANRFVAGFIGSPPMNFFNGTLVENGNGLCFQAEGGEPSLKLQTSNSKLQLRHYVGKRVVLGLRPESIRTQTAGSEAKGTAGGGGVEAAAGSLGGIPALRGEAEAGMVVEAVAEVVEALGPQTHLYLAREGHRFVARGQVSDHVRAGQRVSALFDLRAAHFFDPATERTIA